MTGAQEQNNRRGGDRENQDYQDSGSCQLQAKAPVEGYRRIHPRIDNDASGRRKKRSGEKYPCAVTSEKWRQMYKEKEDAKEREREDEKRIKREEREKKRTLNEELKMKRMQERSDKQKKKDEEKQHKVQACPKKHKRKSTNLRLHSSRNVGPTKERKRRGNWSGTPGKSGLEWSRCRDKVHVSCVGKAYLQYVEGYDDSDDDDFEFLCTRCFRFDDNTQSTRVAVSLIT